MLLNYQYFKKIYAIAIVSIVCLIIASQIIIHINLRKQAEDGRIINYAGKQRTLSQSITKSALTIQFLPKPIPYNHQEVENLSNLVAYWERIQDGLQSGDKELHLPRDNNSKIKSLFEEINPYYINILSGANLVVKNPNDKDMDQLLSQILENEKIFLPLMDEIVDTYEELAATKVKKLQRIEIILAAISILIILLELLFIFKPAISKLQNSNTSLNELNTKLKDNNVELQKTQNSLNQHILRLKAAQGKLNKALDQYSILSENTQRFSSSA